jgi:putative membrane protein
MKRTNSNWRLTMMNWNGGWGWFWLMIPMMLVMWAVIALLILPWLRTSRDQPPSPIALLDRRLAAGEITIEEYRSRRSELEHGAPV